MLGAVTLALSACAPPLPFGARALPQLDTMRITARGELATLTPFPITDGGGGAAEGLWQAVNRLPTSHGTLSCPATSLGSYTVAFYHQGVDEASVTIAPGGCGSVSLGSGPLRSLDGNTGDGGDVYAILSQALGYPVLQLDELLPQHQPGACIPTPIDYGVAGGLGVPNVPRVPWALGPTDENATRFSIYAFLSFATGGNAVLRAGHPMGIVWVVPDLASRGDHLDVSAFNLWNRQTLRATVPLGPDGQYPSTIDVPAPGCWRFTVRSGTAVGTVTLQAAGG